MNRQQKNRLMAIIVCIVLLGSAAGLVLYALKQNINLFYTPTELLQSHPLPTDGIRIGGYVKNRSVKYDKSGQTVRFIVTDRKNELTVIYRGILPNLFREGQTVVVGGKLEVPHTFIADLVLAKHGERYKPKSVGKYSYKV